MTTEQAKVLVLKDSAGSYYLVPEEILERGRVPQEHMAELEQHVNDADVSGHSISLADFFCFYFDPATEAGRILYQFLYEQNSRNADMARAAIDSAKVR
jgi:hypothetical protein